MDESGRVTNFAMNDKCAAGTGRFLEVMARALEADLDEFGALSLRAERPARSAASARSSPSRGDLAHPKGRTRENIIAGSTKRSPPVSAMASRSGLRRR